MTENNETGDGVSRRTVLRRGVASGPLAVGGFLATGTASAKQGGAAFLRKTQLRGKNNPSEPRFRIIERCPPGDETPPCDEAGDRAYAAYKIRCPNFPGGGGGGAHDGGDTDDRSDEDGCPGGGTGRCGRRILVNPNRNIRTGDLHVFASYRECGTDSEGRAYVKAAFRPV